MPTEEFLKLLQQGNYHLVSQWLRYINAKIENSKANADALMPVAVFELINHGFSGKDKDLLVGVTRLLQHGSNPLQGEDAYAATFFRAVAIQILAYAECDVLSNFHNEKLTDLNTIVDWMGAQNSKLPKNIHELVGKYDLEIIALAEEPCHTGMQEIIAKIMPTIQAKKVCLEYKEQLQVKLEDKNAAMRYGLACALFTYLQNQTQLTEECTLKIASYVQKIREHAPQEEENKYLDQLAPPQPQSWLGVLMYVPLRLLGIFSSEVKGFIEEDEEEKKNPTL